MNNTWKIKFMSFIHSTSVFYKRLYFALITIIIGAALLSLLSLIEFVKKVIYIFKVSPNGTFVGIVVFIVFPVLAFMLDKSFSTNIDKR